MAGPEHEPTPSTPSDQPPKRKRRRRRRRPASQGGSGTRQSSSASDRAAPPAAQAKANDAAASAASEESTSSGSGAAKGAGRSRSKGKRRRSGQRRSEPTAAPKKHIPTTREVSAGGVVYRLTDDDEIEVVLASRRTRRGQLAWGLAKGGIEPGESKEEAAIREVREETGLTADIEADLGDTKYMYVWDDLRIRKTVHFFLMRHTGGNVDDRDDEMEEIRWFPLDRAIKRSAYRGERDMLVKASELLR
jgi:8-oxo-dGTP pyrophosphatase MutT (NUDIX family)